MMLNVEILENIVDDEGKHVPKNNYFFFCKYVYGVDFNFVNLYSCSLDEKRKDK
jgi:hypothetical protein